MISMVEPAVVALAARLFVLSTYRPGTKKFKPTVDSFYETSIVTSIYEFMLMSPVMAHLEIRHEMPFPSPVPQPGAPKKVDLWLRPFNGGYPHLVEAGDFGAKKIHRDLAKAKALNPNGANWFLAFFRTTKIGSLDPSAAIEKSFNRKNGLDDQLVLFDRRLTKQFTVYQPGADPIPFGASLLRAK